MILLEGVDVHIGDWGKLLLSEFSTGGSSPMGLNGLHVPLVDNCNDVLFLNVENFSENSLSSPINQNLLLLWSNFVEHTDQEVDSASIT